MVAVFINPSLDLFGVEVTRIRTDVKSTRALRRSIGFGGRSVAALTSAEWVVGGEVSGGEFQGSVGLGGEHEETLAG